MHGIHLKTGAKTILKAFLITRKTIYRKSFSEVVQTILKCFSAFKPFETKILPKLSAVQKRKI